LVRFSDNWRTRPRQSGRKKGIQLKADFILSAAHFSDCPEPSGVEICVMGRSNVGKSSFVNHIFENYSLAKVSKKPGKTTLANFYRITDGSVWVDLPGYGYARSSSTEKLRWGRLIEDYYKKRTALRGVVWLLDIRHPGLPIDKQAYNWFCTRNISIMPVLTKCDKLSNNAIVEHIKAFRREFSFELEPMPYSVLTTKYRERFWTRYAAWLAELSQQAAEDNEPNS
jgi:GTP-binding protein